MIREMQRRMKRIQRSHLRWIGGAEAVGRGVVVVVTAALVSWVPVAYSWAMPSSPVRRWGLAMLRFAPVTAGAGLESCSIADDGDDEELTKGESWLVAWQGGWRSSTGHVRQAGSGQGLDFHFLYAGGWDKQRHGSIRRTGLGR